MSIENKKRRESHTTRGLTMKARVVWNPFIRLWAPAFRMPRPPAPYISPPQLARFVHELNTKNFPERCKRRPEHSHRGWQPR